MNNSSSLGQGTASLRPPLKWAGGKRWLAPKLQTIWAKHQHRRLVEPFCGGLAVALALQPKHALLNDINTHLINFYWHLQQGITIGVEMINDSEVYYRQRARFNALINQNAHRSAEAAGLLYYLNRTGYNGLCRFNRQGLYNVPFGRYQKINYVTDFSAYQHILHRWNFICADFGKINLEKNDFIYADPPYDNGFTHYVQGGFSWEDQQRLAHWLAAHKGPVVVSNHATERIVKLYRQLGFTLSLLDAPRRISCTGKRDSVKEMFATRQVVK